MESSSLWRRRKQPLQEDEQVDRNNNTRWGRCFRDECLRSEMHGRFIWARPKEGGTEPAETPLSSYLWSAWTLCYLCRFQRCTGCHLPSITTHQSRSGLLLFRTSSALFFTVRKAEGLLAKHTLSAIVVHVAQVPQSLPFVFFIIYATRFDERRASKFACWSLLKVGFGRGVAPAWVSAPFRNCACATLSFMISVNAIFVSWTDGIANAVGVLPLLPVAVGLCVCPQAASNPAGMTMEAPTIERRRKIGKHSLLLLPLL